MITDWDFLLKEDGDRLLQESGYKIILNEGEPNITLNNYLFVTVENGMSTSEKIR